MRIFEQGLSVSGGDLKGFDLAGVRVGDVLHARVLEIMEDMVLLSVKGEKIAAKTEIPLQGNQQIKIMLQGFDNGVIKFKIDSSSDGSTTLENGIVNALEDMGLAPSEKNVEVSKTLLANKLPVDSLTVNAIDRLLPGVSEATFKQELQEAISLLKMDIPLTKENIQVLVNVNNSGISKLLQSVADNLLYIDNESSESTQNSKMNTGSVGDESIGHGIVKRASAEGAANRVNLESLSSVNTGVEKNIPSPATGSSDFTNLNKMAMEFLAGFDVLGTKEEISAAISRSFTENSSVKLFEILGELSKIEKKEQQNLQEFSSREKPGTQVLEKIRETKSHVVEMVKGFAKDTLMTLQDRPVTENNNIYLNLPLNIENTWYDTKIHINSDIDKENKTDFNKKVFVRIDVETKHLGSVGVKLEILDNGASCTVFVEDSTAYSVFSEATEELKVVLGDTYNDVRVSVEILSTDILLLKEEDNDIRFTRMDFKV